MVDGKSNAPLVTDTLLTIRESSREAFLVLTRLYLQRMRREPGVVRGELLQRMEGPSTEYVLHEVFRSQQACAVHVAEAHTKQYAQAVHPLLTAQPLVVQFDVTACEPFFPPRPRGKSRAAWERAGHDSAQWSPDLPRMRVLLQRLELAAATEARPFAGRADPCLVSAAYVLSKGKVEVLGRSLIRLPLSTDAPCSLESKEALIDVRLGSDDGELTIVLLVIGLEENGGSDVRRAYQCLEVPDALRVWAPSSAVPDPIGLAEFADNRANTMRNAQPVELLLSEQLLSEAFDDDEWVGAALHVFTIGAALDDPITRFHLGAKPNENDWVVSALTQVRS